MDGSWFSRESLFEKLNHLRRALRMQVRHHVSSAFRNVTSARGGREIPMIAASVLDRGATLTVFMIGRWIKRSRAGRQGAFVDSVNVFNIEMKRRRSRRAFPTCAFTAATNHHHRIADLVFRVITSRGAEAVYPAFSAKHLR